MEKAKAAVLEAANRPFVIREYPVTEPPEGYARLKLAASGVCGTDLHIRSGKLGAPSHQIIGHEFIGVIDAIAPGDAAASGFSNGDRAIVCIACPCGECALCKSGDDANCLNMGVTNAGDPEAAPHFHGGFAEYSFAPLANLIRLPEPIDPVMASVFACPGPTTLHAFSLARRANIEPEKMQTAVVQGLGPVGCFAVMYLAFLGVPNIIAIANRKDTAKDKLFRQLGASEILYVSNTGEAEMTARINEISGGAGADLVFEASGRPEAIPLGLAALRNRGVYLVPGQYSQSGGIDIQPQLITFKALQIIGSSQYNMSDVAEYVNFLEQNPQFYEVIQSLASCYSVSDINRAFVDATERKNIKTVLVP